MKRVVGVFVVGAIVGASGCGPAAPPDAADNSHNAITSSSGTAGTSTVSQQPTTAPSMPPEKVVVAEVAGQPITEDQLLQRLIESHGLSLLLNLAELDLAKQDVKGLGLTVTPDDIKNELAVTLEKMFPDQAEADRPQLLDGYLEKRNAARNEFDLVMELTAYIRKSATHLVEGKIKDDAVEKEFGSKYGETAKCRMIVLANQREAMQALQRTKTEDFAEVARQMSRDARSAPLGGELPPFSRQTDGIPQIFRDVAFALEPGHVSDPLAYGTNWYLIKLEQKFPPKAVKFDSVKEELRKSMYVQLTEAVMKDVRNNLVSRVVLQLSIHDPVLAKQFEAFKAKQEGAIRDQQKLNEQWRRERAAATEPTTEPASDLTGPPTTSTTAPATQPAASAPSAATATQPAAR